MNNILVTKVKLYRNLKDHKFTSIASATEQTNMLNNVLSVIKDCNLKGGVLNELSESVIDSLIANGQIDRNFASDITGKGYACGDNVDVEIGGDEHVCIIAKDYDIFNAYKNAKDLDKKLCNKLNFAYSDKYGFLTSNITRIGSGMDIEIKIMLPALNKLNAIRTIPKLNEKLLFDIKCLDEVSGLCLITTGANLGYTEKQICELSNDYINKIFKLEIEACKQLNTLDADDILDGYKRATAILNNCVKISQNEVCKLVGDILILINAGIGNNVDTKKLKQILNLNNDENLKQFAENIKKYFK